MVQFISHTSYICSKHHQN